MKRPLQVKSKYEMQAIDVLGSQAMMALQQLQSSEKTTVAVDREFLETLCHGYIVLYHKLMDHKALPTPTNQRRFHTNYH